MISPQIFDENSSLQLQPSKPRYAPNLNLSIRDSNQISSLSFNLLTRDSSKASTAVSSGSSPIIVSPFEDEAQTIFNFQLCSQDPDHSLHLPQDQISCSSPSSQDLFDSLTSPQKSQFSCLNVSSKKIAKNQETCYKKKRSGWSLKEDDLVLELVKKYGTKWSAISANMQGRTGKQIRDRYLHVLSASMKKIRWTEAEDQLILAMYKKIGPQWTKISELLEPRTGLQVKNRFHTHLKRKEEEISESSEYESQANELEIEEGFIRENFMDGFNASEILFDPNENM